jgi:O-methyltransferase involved in polyketide biosynthesis
MLKKAGFQTTESALLIWEGVSYYLDPESVDATLNYVSQKTHPDSRLAFDYTISLNNQNIGDYYGADAFARTMKEEHGDEALRFSIKAGGIKPYLAGRGLKVVEHLDYHDIEQRYLTNQKGVQLGNMTAHFCFVLAGPTTGTGNS